MLKCSLFYFLLLCWVLLFFSFDPCLFLSLTLHLQMGDESEPVTALRKRANHDQFTSGHFIASAPSVLDFTFPELPSVSLIPHSLHLICQLYLLTNMQPHPPVHLSPSLIYALCNVSHVISHPFPCGRRLLSHLTLPISPHPPLITAPRRFVQGTRYSDLPPLAFQSPFCAHDVVVLHLHYSHQLVPTSSPQYPCAHRSLFLFLNPPKPRVCVVCCFFLFFISPQ